LCLEILRKDHTCAHARTHHETGRFEVQSHHLLRKLLVPFHHVRPRHDIVLHVMWQASQKALPLRARGKHTVPMAAPHGCPLGNVLFGKQAAPVRTLTNLALDQAAIDLGAGLGKGFLQFDIVFIKDPFFGSKVAFAELLPVGGVRNGTWSGGRFEHSYLGVLFLFLSTPREKTVDEKSGKDCEKEHVGWLLGLAWGRK